MTPMRRDATYGCASGGGTAPVGFGAPLLCRELARPHQRLPGLCHATAPDRLRVVVEGPVGLGGLEQGELSFHGFIFPGGCDSQKVGEAVDIPRTARTAAGSNRGARSCCRRVT